MMRRLKAIGKISGDAPSAANIGTNTPSAAMPMSRYLKRSARRGARSCLAVRVREAERGFEFGAIGGHGGVVPQDGWLGKEFWFGHDNWGALASIG
jgi:hypothetical protein